MSAPEEKKTIYALYIVRNDIGPMGVFESDNYDNVFVKWKELKEMWTTAIENKVPFEILEPVVTAFDPGLIMEITLKPVVETTASRYNNPYERQMVEKGLTSTLKSYHPELNDGGYK